MIKIIGNKYTACYIIKTGNYLAGHWVAVVFHQIHLGQKAILECTSFKLVRWQ